MLHELSYIAIQAKLWHKMLDLSYKTQYEAITGHELNCRTPRTKLKNNTSQAIGQDELIYNAICTIKAL